MRQSHTTVEHVEQCNAYEGRRVKWQAIAKEFDPGYASDRCQVQRMAECIMRLREKNELQSSIINDLRDHLIMIDNVVRFKTLEGKQNEND